MRVKNVLFLINALWSSYHYDSIIGLSEEVEGQAVQLKILFTFAIEENSLLELD